MKKHKCKRLCRHLQHKQLVHLDLTQLAPHQIQLTQKLMLVLPTPMLVLPTPMLVQPMQMQEQLTRMQRVIIMIMQRKKMVMATNLRVMAVLPVAVVTAHLLLEHCHINFVH